MPQSFVSLHVHAVFSTKHRLPQIDESLATRLFEFVGGILRKRDCVLIAAGGISDHVHLLFDLNKVEALADILRDVKSNSSGWIHQEFPSLKNFAWQTGYGAFAVSCSGIPDVTNYIKNQADHHRARSFQEEFRMLLEKHRIPHKEEYLWD